VNNEQLSETSQDRARGRAKKAALVTVTILLLIVAAFVLFSNATFLEFRLSVLLKLGAGVVATILLAAGLMAAVFYSDDSGHDDDVSNRF
jgi:preprotein translocase subunit SecF